MTGFLRNINFGQFKPNPKIQTLTLVKYLTPKLTRVGDHNPNPNLNKHNGAAKEFYVVLATLLLHFGIFILFRYVEFIFE